MTTNKVIVINKMKVVRDAIVSTLHGHHDANNKFEVLISSSLFDDAVTSHCDKQPGIILLEVTSDKIGPRIKQLQEKFPNLIVVLWGVSLDMNEIIQYAQYGVAGYITYEDTEAEWLAAVLGALRNEVTNPVIAGILNRYVFESFRTTSNKIQLHRQNTRKSSETHFGSPQLTHREIEVVTLIDQGLSNKEIARQLNVELSTVKNHVHSILGKFRVTRRIQAAAQYRSQSQEAVSA